MVGLSSLRRLDRVPESLLGAGPRDLHAILGGPTVIDLAGDRPPVFVASLLHGNETSGWLALREVFRDLGDAPLVALLGNLDAARLDVRSVQGQPDHNRVWREGANGVGGDYWALREELATRGVTVAVDLHNNNAPNPLHAICMSRDGDVESAAWAEGYSGVVVRSTLSQGTCMEAFAEICPSVTLECGEPGDAEGVELAVRYLGRVLEGVRPVWVGETRSYSMAARVTVREGVSVGFGEGPADLVLPAEAPERWNFTLLKKGTEFARLGNGASEPLLVTMTAGRGAGDYMAVKGKSVVATRDIVPAMLVDKAKIIEDDCLCYILEPEGPVA